MQPFVTKPAGGFQLCVPLPSKGAHRNSVRGNGVGSLDLQVSEVNRHILQIDPRMYEDFKKRRRRIRRAVDDSPAARMPSAWRAQAATSVQFGMVADTPKDHAKMPSSICAIVSSTRRAPASVASIPRGDLPSKRSLGFRNQRQARFGSPKTCSAMAVSRATRTALSDSPWESDWCLAMRCARVLRGTINW